MTLNTVLLAAMERGLTVSDVRRMTIGQVVDFCQAYNERLERAERQKDKPKVRAATQADIDAYFG